MSRALIEVGSKRIESPFMNTAGDNTWSFAFAITMVTVTGVCDSA